MPSTALQIPPGVHADLTEYDAEGKWHKSNRIRFRDGRPEPIGGWQKMLGDSTALAGVPRALHAWSEIDGTINLSIGTSTKLYVVQGGVASDITPVRASGPLGTDPFTTTNASANVSVAHTAHGLEVGASATFGGAAAVGGITIDGEYLVVTVTNADTYVITHSAAATSSASGGGASVTYSYQINPGRSVATFGYGWGAGAFNVGTFNTARTSSNVVLDLRTWSLGNFGEDLLCSPRNGKLYAWDSSVGVATPAAIVSAAPTAFFYLISPDDRHVIAFGEDGDPLGIKWCDQGDYTNWTQSASTTAGERRLLRGSKIRGGLVTKSEILVWTDVSLHSMLYTGDDFTFDLQTIGAAAGLFGVNAVIERNGVAFWMADGSFQIYDGTIRDMQCTVLRHVFDDIDRSQREKVIAGMYETRHEVWWFYPSLSGAASECDRYVKYNWRDNAWDYGTLDRTFWIDKAIFNTPLAVDASGYIYEHEVGTYLDDGDALGEFIESGDFDIADGDRIMFVKGCIPDFVGGPASLTFKARKFPNGTQTEKGPFEVTTATTRIRPRARGRLMALRIDGGDGVYWRLGRPTVDIKPNGKQ